MSDENFKDLIDTLKQHDQLKSWFLVIEQMPSSMRVIELKKIALELKQKGVPSAIINKLELLETDEAAYQVVGKSLG